MPAASRAQLVRQFITFNLVGLMNTAVDFAIFTLLIWLGLNVPLSQVVSYSAGMGNSYVMNRLVTFKSGKVTAAASRKQALRFLALNLAVLAVSLGLLHAATSWLGLHPLLSKLLVTGVTMVLNFVGSRSWVFRNVAGDGAAG
ncbi:GtrA family protein [Paenibacillus sp. GCM10023252]|uniref:GtrA family protein n=1 Tax=Paenibacillus sp. GCM10023252 TaxID=3252649 RepID=UPI00362090DD